MCTKRLLEAALYYASILLAERVWKCQPHIAMTRLFTRGSNCPTMQGQLEIAVRLAAYELSSQYWVESIEESEIALLAIARGMLG
jgi:hypothetical protein